MTKLLIDQIKAEFFEYTKTAAAHESSVDEFCIMQQCFEELPGIVSDDYANRLLGCFYTNFNSDILLDRKTIKQLIVAMTLLEVDPE